VPYGQHIGSHHVNVVVLTVIAVTFVPSKIVVVSFGVVVVPSRNWHVKQQTTTISVPYVVQRLDYHPM